LVADEHYAQRVLDIAAQITEALDQPTVLTLLRQGVAALGAERAVFISFVRQETEVSTCRFMLDCDPGWCQRYLQAGFLAQDPWLAYAARQSEPVVASALHVLDDAQRRVVALAQDAGFGSTVLVPAHSAAGHARISVLCLGHSQPGYFERGGFTPLRVCARALSAELHGWWLGRIRRELVVKSRIRPRDLVLLEHECQGHSSQRIAAELHISPACVDSRFQRMIAKLGVPNRRCAARLAVECGLIVK
jgi:DNA-binding CsgD family transcriptional regulator